jgi:hypothetical protein
MICSFGFFLEFSELALLLYFAEIAGGATTIFVLLQSLLESHAELEI